jgi:hypothetical protein
MDVSENLPEQQGAPDAVPGVIKSTNKSVRPEKQAETKANIVLKRLRSAKGVTISALADATGWQPHSIRGFLSGTVKKKLSLSIVSEIGKDGVRRYRIENTSKAQ